MKIVLLGNYRPDRQESMERFALMLANGFQEVGFEVEIWRPCVCFGSMAKSTISGIGKWLGYIDKWFLFPFLIRWRLLCLNLFGKTMYFHICDHSNAPYLQHLPADRTGITCHDVLAIRGAFGEAEAYCKASALGYYYQKWILRNLTKAKYLAAVSEQTLHQLDRLAQSMEPFRRDWRVVYNAFNNDFKPLKEQESSVILSEAGLNPQVPFILHVGSDLPRKNRKLLLEMAVALGDNWKGNICYAGEGADERLLMDIEDLGLQERVIFVVKPDHNTLVSLYSACAAFVFPSFSEGFGWPLIEAQACGAPVIASIIEPMPEVSGGAALYASPNKPQEFADAFLSLKDERKKSDLIRRGFANTARFNSSHMIESYLDLYGLSTYTQNMYVA